jgi:stage IV sporulation protein B
MFTNGVVVVGLADIKTAAGTINPASEAGLKTGDVILSIDGKTVTTNYNVEDAVESCNGHPMKLTVSRDGKKLSVEVTHVQTESYGHYKMGLWVRDSTAGIGTLTFYDPAGKCFAGLGHGICDSDTGQLMPLLSGDIVPVTISGVTKGLKGTPGELRGYFSDDKAIGTLSANITSGVYGIMNQPIQSTPRKIGMKQDVRTGPAKVYTTINGNSPKYYSIEIEKIDYRDGIKSKNLVLHITDPQLLAQTGGIVQGMSGSPIIQDGKLVGAVTHVFVNDPTRGYGIFAENMLTQSKAIGAQEKKLAS